MAHPLTLPALGATLIAAAAFGIHLGESAIADINPLYFQGPAIHPRDRGAAIDEVPLETPQPSFADAYGWEEGESARAAECAGCGAAYLEPAYEEAVFWVPTASYPRERSAAGAVEVYGVANHEVEVEAIAPERRNVERYAYYPIEEAAPAVEDAYAEAKAEPDPEPVVYYSE